jgi:3-methyladenine DNA glycosylase AlkD
MVKTAKATAIDNKFTASQFLKELNSLKSTAVNNTNHFKGEDKLNKFLHVRMADIFRLAKQFSQMSLGDIEHLLNSDFYEARVGAVSIMDFKARDKKFSEEMRKQLYELYIKRHDRINNWDMVDRSAPFVVGGWLFDKSRAPLYKLAKSKNVWERRTAIVSTWYFIRQNDVDDTFKIAGMLVNDKEELINTAVGSWIREAGKRDKQQLLDFLDTHAATMPRIALRYAVEKLDNKTREHYMGAKK